MAQLSRARDRSMHSIVATIQAEQDQAIRAPGKGVVVDLRRPRHRQDGRRAAPRGVPPLHRPPPLRGRRRADRRPERRVHALHRAGAAVARRDRGRAALAGRGRRRRPRHPARRAGGRRREGLGADGRAAAAYGAAAGARQPERVPDLLPRRRDHARPRAARPAPPPADVAGPAQPAAARGSPRPCSTPCGARSRASAAATGAARRSTTRCCPNQAFVDVRGLVVAAAGRARGAVVAARPRLPGPGRRGRRQRRRTSGCSRSRGAATARCRSRTCRCSTSCATRSATCRPGTRTTTSSTTTSAPTCRS